MAARTQCDIIHVGVLAIQGGFKEIAAALVRQQGVVAHEIRTPEDLSQVAALVLPGGESTSIGRGLEFAGLLDPLRQAVHDRKLPVFGICAGLILLCNEIAPDSKQPRIQGLDVTVQRNYFGRQSRSRFRRISLSEAGREAGVSDGGHFIRAPVLLRAGDAVTVLASVRTPNAGGKSAELDAKEEEIELPVAVRQGHILGVAFHPEVAPDDTYLQYFLREVVGFSPTANSPPGIRLAPATVPPLVSFAEEEDEEDEDETAGPMVGLGIPSVAVGQSEVLSRSVLRAFPIFQQGGVIMDVVNGEQARIAEEAGAVSVMALERIPADIKKDGGLARMSDPAMIQEVMAATSLPVMAKARIGHFAEARVLEHLNVDCIDESEVLTPADETHHIDKRRFRIPFVCGAKNLGEALRRIAEGASMIRLKGNAGTGNVVQAVRHARAVFAEIRQLKSLRRDELYVFAKQHAVPVELVAQVRKAGRLPVVTFAAGGLATPADVSLLMQLGCDGVFVGSGIFKGENPAERARAMVQAATHFRDAGIVARVSTGLGKAMVGILDDGEKYAAAGLNSDSLL